MDEVCNAEGDSDISASLRGTVIGSETAFIGNVGEEIRPVSPGTLINFCIIPDERHFF